MKWVAVASVVLLPPFAVACGGSQETRKPGYVECADAWNAAGNAHDRATVAQLNRGGYTHAGIQMSLTLGGSRFQNPNPVGCRLVVFNDRHWVAYLAKRDGERFVFRTGRPQYVADQSGGWPPTSTPGPDNAKVSLSGEVAVAVDQHGLPVSTPGWRSVLDDFVDDGHVNRPHSCAAVRTAIAHAHSDLNPQRRPLGGAEDRYCGG